jgi:hypothetical protein
MKYSELDAVAKEYGFGQSDLYQIPSSVDVKMRLLSGYQVLVRHWVDNGIVKRGYYACIGAKKDCPYCPDEKAQKLFLAYILVDGEVKLAGLPWAIMTFMKSKFEEDPDLFDENENPKFYVKVFRAGTGTDTRYTVEMDEKVNDKKVYSVNEETIKIFIDSKKAETVKSINSEIVGTDTETGEPVSQEDILSKIPF